MRISIYKDGEHHIVEVCEVCKSGVVLSLYGTRMGDLTISVDTEDTADDYYNCLMVKGYCFIDDKFEAINNGSSAPFMSKFFTLTPDMHKVNMGKFKKLSAKAIRRLCEEYTDVAKALVFDDYKSASEIGRINFDSALMMFEDMKDKALPTKHYVTLIKRTWEPISKKLSDELQCHMPRLYTACESGDFSFLEDYNTAVLAGIYYLGVGGK